METIPISYKNQSIGFLRILNSKKGIGIFTEAAVFLKAH